MGEFNKAVDMGMNACMEIYEMQKEAMRKKYPGD